MQYGSAQVFDKAMTRVGTALLSCKTDWELNSYFALIPYNSVSLDKRDEHGFVFEFPESEISSWVLGSQVMEKLPQPIIGTRGLLLKFPNQIKTSD